MRILLWILRLAIFLTLFGLALLNTEDATIRLFFGQFWRVPLILLLFIFFAAGMLFGMLSAMLRWSRKK
ncbi:MAG: LapA family protein [Candidatus Protistobacter heckmanni]|nr:LapA family protein [Candidatus Protistobacter heckmanni]